MDFHCIILFYLEMTPILFALSVILNNYYVL